MPRHLIRFRVVLPLIFGFAAVVLMLWDFENNRMVEFMGMGWDIGPPFWPYQAVYVALFGLNAPAFAFSMPVLKLLDLQEYSLQYSIWFPAILVAILISIFSTHHFTEEHTSRIIIPILHWLLPWASRRALHLMHIGIRKVAHVTEFGVFSALVFRGVRAGQTGWRLNWALTTLVIATTFASLDEWHQSFVPLRQSSSRDVAIDTLGAILAQSIVWWYATRRWPFAAVSDT